MPPVCYFLSQIQYMCLSESSCSVLYSNGRWKQKTYSSLFSWKHSVGWLPASLSISTAFPPNSKKLLKLHEFWPLLFLPCSCHRILWENQAWNSCILNRDWSEGKIWLHFCPCSTAPGATERPVHIPDWGRTFYWNGPSSILGHTSQPWCTRTNQPLFGVK